MSLAWIAPHRRRGIGLAAAGFLSLAGCSPGEAPPPSAGRPVQVVTVAASTFQEAVVLSGDIQAKTDAELAFRIAGRIVERPVAVGDRVVPGQLIARLDPAAEGNALKAAKAAVAAARADVAATRNTYERQQSLLEQGFTTRPRYEQALQARDSAQARLDDAEAQLEAAADRLRFTELKADAAGVVTIRGAEVGEVVQAGRMVVRIAREDGRDAVFEAPLSALRSGASDVPVRIALASDPSVVTSGRVREVSPEADPVTRTFRVRVGLASLPPAMRLGATVKGSFDVASAVVVSIPAGALTSSAAGPSVWVVDPVTSTVSLRAIDVQRFDTAHVVVSQGLDPGEMIVVAGAHALHAGQRVKPLAQPRPRSTGLHDRNRMAPRA
jgi:RND family efflux transporter MFP subunit